jgi:hypothetical protein
MPGEEAGQRHGVLVLRPDPQRERLDAAGEQEAGVRVQAGAVVVERQADAVDELRPAHHAAAHEIGVAAEVLGGAVEAQVEAGRQRPEVHRGRRRCCR